jgi:phosphohistidine phosphatase
MKSSILDKIPNCILDPEGVFKYIQIYVKQTFSEDSKFVIRGYKKCHFHDDNFQDFKRNSYFTLGELDSLGVSKEVEVNCVGGGRVNINPTLKTILVYGYSQGI